MTETFKDNDGTEWTVHRASSDRISIEHPTRSSRFISIAKDSEGIGQLSAQSVPGEVCAYAIKVWREMTRAAPPQESRFVYNAADLTTSQREGLRYLAHSHFLGGGHLFNVLQCKGCGIVVVAPMVDTADVCCETCRGELRQVACFVNVQRVEDWLEGNVTTIEVHRD